MQHQGYFASSQIVIRCHFAGRDVCLRRLPITSALAVGALVIGVSSSALADGRDQSSTPQTFRLAPVEVQSSRLHQNALDTPAAVQMVHAHKTLQGRRKAQLNDTLNEVPGVYATNGSNYVQGLRLSIRGFGARSAFGIRGIRVRVDGIPSTLVDGSTMTDAIDSAAINDIQVRRGPFSVQYGNASGGIVNITTLEPSDGPLNRVNVSAGGDGYRHYVLQSAHEFDDWGVAATASRLHIDGYRHHSRVLENRFTGKLTRQIGETGQLKLITRLLDQPDSLDPGGVAHDRAQNNPKDARPANLKYDARETVTQQTAGMVYTDQFDKQTDYRLNAFYTHRKFDEFLPFGKTNNGGVPSYNRNFFGGGGKVTRHDTLWGHKNQAVLGFDAHAQFDHRKRYNNDFGSKGAQTQNEDQHATDFAIYGQDAFHVTKRLKVTAGLRYDWLNFDVDDHFVTATNGDASGSRHYHRLSASGGVIYTLPNKQRIYANIANSFESPTFDEFANPEGNGGFNPSLGLQKAVNYEIGVKGPIGSQGRYQLDAFWINVGDSIVNYASGSERDYYANAGSSTRKGIEARGHYRLPWHLTLRGAYTLASYEFDDYSNTSGSFGGNRIPGIPEQTLFAGIRWDKADVGYGAVNVRYTGSIYADNANQTKVSSHTEVDVRGGKVLISGKPELTLYGGIKNLFDTDYYSNIRINSYGGRYYEPAPDRTWYAGIKIGF
ncbi:TonB-dependent receptor [Salinisphaera sp. USBA-960]|uniref:TonB-dependent receptor family protein n=1 Tax=Salinisphaera orenii TaxID=856731 RepID=UPI0013A67AFB|nr:TonB-dependent receptor [Salifodinibacter halophilus]NNC25858.1 TonB-dependent receptor [Salifodinibacter halophilus]